MSDIVDSLSLAYFSSSPDVTVVDIQNIHPPGTILVSYDRINKGIQIHMLIGWYAENNFSPTKSWRIKTLSNGMICDYSFLNLRMELCTLENINPAWIKRLESTE